MQRFGVLRIGAAAVAAMLVPGLAGCGASPVSLRVAVRDAQTREALAGVRVIAETPSNNHPFSVKTMLGQTGPADDRARTDERGEASVQGLEGRPVRVSVLGPGALWGVALIDPAPGSKDEASWVLLSRTGAGVKGPAAAPDVEVDVEVLVWNPDEEGREGATR